MAQTVSSDSIHAFPDHDLRRGRVTFSDEPVLSGTHNGGLTFEPRAAGSEESAENNDLEIVGALVAAGADPRQLPDGDLFVPGFVDSDEEDDLNVSWGEIFKRLKEVSATAREKLREAKRQPVSPSPLQVLTSFSHEQSKMVQGLESIQQFASKYGIQDIKLATMIMITARVEIGGSGAMLDEDPRFTKFLEEINDESNDDTCLDLIINIIDGAATYDDSVAEADLHHILRNMDASCAQAIIEDILDEATLDQDSHVHKQETPLKVHADKRARRASRLRRRLDRLSMHQSNLFESSKGPRLIKLESEPDARSVEVDSIPNRAFKEMLRRDENVASVVRLTLKATFKNEFPHLYSGTSRLTKVQVAEDEPEAGTWCLKVKQFVWQNCYPICVWILLLAAFIGRYFQWRNLNGPDVNDDVEVSIAVAKGAGFAILLATCFIYLTKLPFFAWAQIVPLLWNNTSLHAHFGGGLFVFAVIHVVAHFVWQEERAFTTKTDNSTADVSSKYELSAAWLTGTGLVLFAIILAISFTASRRLQVPENYRRFLKVHYLYYLYLPILIMHVPYRTYVLGVIAGCFVVHEFMKVRCTQTGDLTRCDLIGSQTSRLVMNTSKPPVSTLKKVAGTYYKINIPALSQTEWHPFSLATSTSGIREEFFVQNLGKWTEGLQTLLRKPKEDHAKLKLSIMGPYYAPAVQATTEKKAFCVAAGIGITPFLGILHHFVYKHSVNTIETHVNALLHDRRHYMRQRRGHARKSAAFDKENHERVETNVNVGLKDFEQHLLDERGTGKCEIIWTVRDLTLVDFLLPYVADLLALQTETEPLVTVKIFFTGNAVNKMESLVTNVLLLHHFGSYERDGGTHTPARTHTHPHAQRRGQSALQVVLGRPNLKDLILEASPSAAFYCGGPGLLHRLKAVCNDPAVNIPVHEEEFQNAALAKWPSLFGEKSKRGRQRSGKKD